MMDGMQIAVETPISNQLRYFINGGGIRSTEQTTGGEEIATGIDNNGGLINGDASLNDGRTGIYDVLGRQVAVLGENDLLTQLKLPTGVYVITRGDPPSVPLLGTSCSSSPEDTSSPSANACRSRNEKNAHRDVFFWYFHFFFVPLQQ